jgi:hypothetical protein
MKIHENSTKEGVESELKAKSPPASDSQQFYDFISETPVLQPDHFAYAVLFQSWMKFAMFSAKIMMFFRSIIFG